MLQSLSPLLTYCTLLNLVHNLYLKYYKLYPTQSSTDFCARGTVELHGTLSRFKKSSQEKREKKNKLAKALLVPRAKKERKMENFFWRICLALLDLLQTAGWVGLKKKKTLDICRKRSATSRTCRHDAQINLFFSSCYLQIQTSYTHCLHPPPFSFIRKQGTRKSRKKAWVSW